MKIPLLKNRGGRKEGREFFRERNFKRRVGEGERGGEVNADLAPGGGGGGGGSHPLGPEKKVSFI